MKSEDIILVVFALVAVVLILWYIFGHFPTLDQISLGLILANPGFTFKMWGDFQRHLGEHKGPAKESDQQPKESASELQA